MRKTRKIVWYGRVHFHDEAPRFGSGIRGIELIRLGWKYVLLRERATGVAMRMSRSVWDKIAPEGAKSCGTNARKPKSSDGRASTARKSKSKEKNVRTEVDSTRAPERTQEEV